MGQAFNEQTLRELIAEVDEDGNPTQEDFWKHKLIFKLFLNTP